MAVYSEWPLPLPSPHQTNQQNRIESNPLHLAAAADACSTGRSLARMSYAYLIKYIIVGDTGVGKSCTGWKRLSMNCSSRHESNGRCLFLTHSYDKNNLALDFVSVASAACKNLVALIIRSIRCGFGVLLPVVQGDKADNILELINERSKVAYNSGGPTK
ncbi:hypothetical protein EJB05_42441 [Eragrostis curvula]|uniref:Uncharacterized protein n=1 Tax=Eragrostis curvula TaxID=38414 RepID=A0A5J9TC94_9POAL|nr:hypothetical protein EJB05_42441 [Eragrostis curvula]